VLPDGYQLLAAPVTAAGRAPVPLAGAALAGPE